VQKIESEFEKAQQPEMHSYDPLRDENNLGEINSFNSHNSTHDMDDQNDLNQE